MLVVRGLHSGDQPPCDNELPKPVRAKVSYKPNYKGWPTAVLNPTRKLPRDKYTGIVEGTGDCDEAAVKDLKGNEMEGSYRWHFSVGPADWSEW